MDPEVRFKIGVVGCLKNFPQCDLYLVINCWDFLQELVTQVLQLILDLVVLICVEVHGASQHWKVCCHSCTSRFASNELLFKNVMLNTGVASHILVVRSDSHITNSR